MSLRGSAAKTPAFCSSSKTSASFGVCPTATTCSRKAPSSIGVSCGDCRSKLSSSISPSKKTGPDEKEDCNEVHAKIEAAGKRRGSDARLDCGPSSRRHGPDQNRGTNSAPRHNGDLGD